MVHIAISFTQVNYDQKGALCTLGSSAIPTDTTIIIINYQLIIYHLLVLYRFGSSVIPADTTSFLPFFGTDIGLCSVIKPQVRKNYNFDCIIVMMIIWFMMIIILISTTRNDNCHYHRSLLGYKAAGDVRRNDINCHCIMIIMVVTIIIIIIIIMVNIGIITIVRKYGYHYLQSLLSYKAASSLWR